MNFLFEVKFILGEEEEMNRKRGDFNSCTSFEVTVFDEPPVI